MAVIPVTLTDLVAVVSYQDVLDNELLVATALGFPTTAWQPVQVDRTTLAIMAQLASDFSTVVNLLAQGAYASYAAQMVNADGSPITTWMDLRGVDQYNVTRLPSTFAAVDSSGFAITNASTTSYTQGVGTLHFQNPVTLATYTNSANVTVAPSTTTPVAIVADITGAPSSSGPGTITVMMTPLIGCTCTNSKSVIGQDAESNSHYLQRCQAKLGMLSPNGPSQVYLFVSESILDPTQPFYDAALTEAITRVTAIIAPALVFVYIANATGSPSGPDLAIVNAALQAWAVPSGTTAIVSAATPNTIPVSYTAYVPASTGISSGTVTTAVSDALALYFESIPIGGLTDAVSGIVPWSAILSVIATAVRGITSVDLTSPADVDVTLGPTDVAILGAVTGSVVFT